MTNKTTLITGNTYPVKDELKALGGRWDSAAKGWRVPSARADEARQLVSAAPRNAPSIAAQPVSSSRTYRPIKCKVCGAAEKKNSRGYSTVRILRSGECTDCYEERKMGY